ncbi:hypothetical protein HYY71_02020 [Candidatus Woesearchaeota archaeon]|nr:hypothetical protein [Candidatus Woesearchaeota archaeon]
MKWNRESFIEQNNCNGALIRVGSAGTGTIPTFELNCTQERNNPRTFYWNASEHAPGTTRYDCTAVDGDGRPLGSATLNTLRGTYHVPSGIWAQRCTLTATNTLGQTASCNSGAINVPDTRTFLQYARLRQTPEPVGISVEGVPAPTSQSSSGDLPRTAPGVSRGPPLPGQPATTFVSPPSPTTPPPSGTIPPTTPSPLPPSTIPILECRINGYTLGWRTNADNGRIEYNCIGSLGTSSRTGIINDWNEVNIPSSTPPQTCTITARNSLGQASLPCAISIPGASAPASNQPFGTVVNAPVLPADVSALPPFQLNCSNPLSSDPATGRPVFSWNMSGHAPATLTYRCSGNLREGTSQVFVGRVVIPQDTQAQTCSVSARNSLGQEAACNRGDVRVPSTEGLARQLFLPSLPEVRLAVESADIGALGQGISSTLPPFELNCSITRRTFTYSASGHAPASISYRCGETQRNGILRPGTLANLRGTISIPDGLEAQRCQLTATNAIQPDATCSVNVPNTQRILQRAGISDITPQTLGQGTTQRTSQQLADTASLPNLVVSSLTINNNRELVAANTPIPSEAVIRNLGTARSEASIVSYRINNTLTRNVVQQNTFNLNSLEPYLYQSFSGNLPGLPEGTYVIEVCADRRNDWQSGSVIESSEEDNCLKRQFTVLQNLPTTPTATPTVQRSASIDLSCSLSLNNNVYVIGWAANHSGASVQYGCTGSLGSGRLNARGAIDVSATTPSQECRLVAIHPSDGTEARCQQLNIISITTTTPTTTTTAQQPILASINGTVGGLQIISGQPLNLILTGSNFRADSVIAYEGPSSSTISPTTNNAPTQLILDLPSFNLPTGTYNIRVRNPGVPDSNPIPITVVAAQPASTTPIPPPGTTSPAPNIPAPTGTITQLSDPACTAPAGGTCSVTITWSTSNVPERSTPGIFYGLNGAAPTNLLCTGARNAQGVACRAPNTPIGTHNTVLYSNVNNPSPATQLYSMRIRVAEQQAVGTAPTTTATPTGTINTITPCSAPAGGTCQVTITWSAQNAPSPGIFYGLNGAPASNLLCSGAQTSCPAQAPIGTHNVELRANINDPNSVIVRTSVAISQQSTGTTVSAPSPTQSCAANAGAGCGSCNGVIRCDGTCSIADPPNFRAPCGRCNRGTIDCSGNCQGDRSDCGAPGATGPINGGSCGNCGTLQSSCSDGCTFTSSECSNQGVCTPGYGEWLPCGTAGRQLRSCTGSCTWSVGACEEPSTSKISGSVIYEPIRIKCTDTDNGKNVYLRGTAISDAYGADYKVMTDYCYDEYNVNEAACRADGTLETYKYGCLNGCRFGACV